GLKDLDGDVTFITAELVTQNKIQFPAMYNLFRAPGGKPIHPAGFVRASMSIPVFFESYMITDIDCNSAAIREAWQHTFYESDPPSTARFVDGGILSNFPINLFYNPSIRTPRLPTFGIDLDDSDPDDKAKNPFSWSALGYFGRVFNTIRFYYDKDFLLKNHMYQKGVGSIPLQEFKWLNFFLSNQDKMDMFIRGAEAATQFLADFNWDDYKAAQTQARKSLS
ncbi:MAG TPA: Patatin, partial [Chitinophaga sp.]